MRKIIFGIFCIAVVFSAGVCAESGANTLNASSAGLKLLYPHLDYWTGTNIKISGDDASYATSDDSIVKLLENTQKGKDYLGSYNTKNAVGIVLIAVGVGSGAWFITERVLHQIEYDTPGIQADFKTIALLSVMLGGIIAGDYLMIDGINDLFKSINEYNITITGGTGTGVMLGRDIKF